MNTTDPILELRFEWDGVEAMLDGPPSALRRLAETLRLRPTEVTEVPIADGVVVRQGPSDGPLRVSPNETSLVVEGRPQTLEIFWAALEVTADEADEIRKGPVGQHHHIEYLGPGDERFRAPDSTPLVVGSDWPIHE